MGSDFCACQGILNNENESNILSNSKRYSKDISEKKFNNYKKTTDKETLAEEKDTNKMHFGDANSNKYDHIEKPSYLRDKGNNNQKKSIFNFISDNSKNESLSNNNISNNNISNNNISNNNNSINNINDPYKKQFTFKDMTLRSSTGNRSSDNNKDVKFTGSSAKKMFNKEEEINVKEKIKEEEEEEQKNNYFSKHSFNNNSNSFKGEEKSNKNNYSNSNNNIFNNNDNKENKNINENNDNLDYNNYIKDNMEKSSKKNKKEKNNKKGKKAEKDDNKLTADFLLNDVGIGDGEEEKEEESEESKSKSKSKSKEESSEEKNNNKNNESNDYLNYDSNYSDNNYNKKGNDDHFSLCDD